MSSAENPTMSLLHQVVSEPVSGPPEKLAQRVKDNLVKFAAIVRIAGAKAD